MQVQLLLSPLARGAYFASVADIAAAELRLIAPEADATTETVGELTFLCADLPEALLPAVARLSAVQGIFVDWRPQPISADFALPAALVWGAKYAGKTNELLTQLAINVALAHATLPTEGGQVRLLDPTAGRGTTLLWAARYGMSAIGIERDRKAIDDFQRNVKRQTKLERIKHREQKGFAIKKNPDDIGRYLHYDFQGPSARLVIGDSAEAEALTGRTRAHLVVGDLPYGIQHRSRRGRRNPIEDIAACAPAWADRLLPGGAMVLVFNALTTKRDAMANLLTAEGLTLQPFAAPHRMSESILRDLIVFTRPR